MDVEVIESQYHGRAGELTKLKAEMNNEALPHSKRRKAAQTFYKIVEQCNDKQLMEYRHRLIRAAQAGDRDAIGRISYQMKQYLGEDPESGTYDS